MLRARCASTPASVLALWLVLAVTALPARSQTAAPPANPSTFSGEERVTAVDVLVEVEKKRTQDLKAGTKEELAATDFAIRVDGAEREITGLRTFADANAEPWTLVVYFDQVLTSSRALRWAASALTEEAANLTRLGKVEVIVADPLPHVLLPPTRDAELLGATLGQLAVSAEGLDRLVEARADFLRLTTERKRLVAAAPAETPPAETTGPDDDSTALEEEVAATTDLGELRRKAIAAEQIAVEHQQDQLLLRLAASDAGPRRALLLVSGGWDVDPAAFYAPGDRDPMPDEIEEPALGPSSGELARALAAYNWVVVDLLRPEVPPEKYFPRGKRVGKWRMTGFLWTYEDQRDPEKAEALLQLGDARKAEGSYEEAAEAYRQAIHHFYKDPRTAKRQAAAFAGLADSLAALGQEEDSRFARQQAAELDPTQGEGKPAAGAVLFDPAAPLEALADSTAGAIVQSPAALSDALAGLDHRVGLSFQLVGPPLGRLLPLEVSTKKSGLELRAPGWVRSSTPEGVSAARARRMVEGDELPPDPRADLETSARYLPGTSAASGSVEVDLSNLVEVPEGTPPQSLLVRVTLALGGPDLAPEVQSDLLELRRSPTPNQRRWSLPVTLPPGTDRITVVIEDLGTGSWSGQTLELGDPVGEVGGDRSE
ncbi:MAG: hypothetical protein KDD11_20000 [Acidobacteria bacterium]|nr:hypothetical protein [Acidobacteriota bacterium]